jgi:hypothetical protein
MTRLLRRSFVYGTLLSGLLLFTPVRSLAADTAVLPTPEEPIPEKHYKTWSLFVVANPDWLLDQSNDKLEGLYQRFNAFGRAIGRDNVAVWFWSETPKEGQYQKAVDVIRGAALCKQLNLKPSEGPYVLVTTTYPGKSVMTAFPESFPKSGTNLLIMKLHSTDAASTTKLLNDLTDKLVREDLAALQPKPEDYWAGWRRAFGKVSDSILGAASKITVSVDAGPIKTEIKIGP